MQLEKIKDIIRTERLRVTRVMPRYLEMLGDAENDPFFHQLMNY